MRYSPKTEEALRRYGWFPSGLAHGILDERGRIRRAVLAARDRGCTSTSATAKARSRSGSANWRSTKGSNRGPSPPTCTSTTSTARYGACSTSCPSSLGLPLRDIVERVTVTPARVIGRLGEVGTLAVGAHGDAAVLELREGDVDLVDSYGDTRRAGVTFTCHAVVRAGERVTDPTDRR